MEQNKYVAPLYAARVEDLRHGPELGATCLACEHEARVPVALIQQRLPPHYRVTELWRHFRCANCGTRGRVIVDARQALGHTA